MDRVVLPLLVDELGDGAAEGPTRSLQRARCPGRAGSGIRGHVGPVMDRALDALCVVALVAAIGYVLLHVVWQLS